MGTSLGLLTGIPRDDRLVEARLPLPAAFYKREPVAIGRALFLAKGRRQVDDVRCCVKIGSGRPSDKTTPKADVTPSGELRE
jgi:hypothetical protein